MTMPKSLCDREQDKFEESHGKTAVRVTPTGRQETDIRQTVLLLRDVLKELKIISKHLEQGTGLNINQDDNESP